MTRIEAARLEQAIVDGTGTLPEVVRFMSLSGRLWHDTVHGIANNIGDREVRNKIDRSPFIVPGHEKKKCAKYEALRQVANYFALLADTFLAIEEAVE
jgi:hypothetical protein